MCEIKVSEIKTNTTIEIMKKYLKYRLGTNKEKYIIEANLYTSMNNTLIKNFLFTNE
jgi:hypothetical protein